MDQTTMIITLTIVHPQGCLSVCQCPPCATIPTPNLDFPGINLPSLLQDARADHPGRFNDASYSEYEFLDVATVLVLWEYWFDNDGGGKTKPAVIVDGETYRIVELRRGAVVPCQQSSSYHPSERIYWLRSELRGTIYRCVWRGTVLRCLNPPVCMSVDAEGSAVVEAGWMSTSVHVVIKEMTSQTQMWLILNNMTKLKKRT